MNRRGFLGGILALASAPAIVRADSLMRVVATDATIIIPFDAPDHPFVSNVAETFDQMIRRTMREHRKELEANIRAHNAVLARMRQMAGTDQPLDTAHG